MVADSGEESEATFEHNWEGCCVLSAILMRLPAWKQRKGGSSHVPNTSNPSRRWCPWVLLLKYLSSEIIRKALCLQLFAIPGFVQPLWSRIILLFGSFLLAAAENPINRTMMENLKETACKEQFQSPLQEGLQMKLRIPGAPTWLFFMLQDGRV